MEEHNFSLDNECDSFGMGVFITKETGEIAYFNSYGEIILNQLYAVGIKEPKNYITEKIKARENFIKISENMLGLKYKKIPEGLKVLIISVNDFNFKIDKFIDIYSMLHELKNPLTVIDGTAQLLTVKVKDDYAQKCSGIIVKECERIKKIIEDMKIISDIQLEYSYFSIVDFFNEIFDSLKIIFSEIIFKIEIDSNHTFINGDREKLFRAFYNIIKNGCEAQKKGDIRVMILSDPSFKYFNSEKNRLTSMLRFSIIDKGPGLDEKVRNSLFTPFFSTKNKGTGLGLVIAREIIEKHSGRITLSSEVGVGTTFNIHLPY